ncbi:hypothetical protein IFM47457_01152 [Aspergillus lentulus]|uniref:Nascent polypeptide-associated complex subunit alpha-like UBA domain-containing protein n=1 Tax=Aspergillus lentulus TaxID=293939 RepID=A0ABQ0ZXD3_ASPLE|nr:hypothetical protein IFM62136_02497 [Aspergillus lentulus]GFF65768.1 hypothetical protein IFM47457_01152 [Aspergillus lentulus]GFF68103.1 hypothetical protein IFM60648_02484 [Aspergillus lentulus]
MSDSLPSASHDPDSIEGSPPAHAEDRKAAAALSSLHTNEIGAESGNKSSSADQEALGKAMSRLEIAPGTDAAARTVDAKKTQAVTKKAVKVSAEDVNLLVQELDLSKIKATELLKAHDGDARKAIRAFISPVGA